MAKRNESSLAEFDLNGGPRSGKVKRRKRKGKKSSKQHYEFKDKKSTNSSIVSSSCGTTPIPSYPVNRPNLAATLRVQSARQKVRDLAKPKSIVPRNKLTETAVNPTTRSQSKDSGGWGVRKSPAWRSMNYDPSNVEDIAVRLATRRAEQRLRQEEHEISMELMKQRVRAAPLLLEGPTYWGPKVGQLSHHCRSTELDRESRRRSGRRSRNDSSKLSFYSTDICEEEK